MLSGFFGGRPPPPPFPFPPPGIQVSFAFERSLSTFLIACSIGLIKYRCAFDAPVLDEILFTLSGVSLLNEFAFFASLSSILLSLLALLELKLLDSRLAFMKLIVAL